MAMEIRRIIPDAHDQAVLCVAFNPHRREIYTGSQDSTIKVWESETGKLLRVLTEHMGWVTGMVYSSEVRMLFSCSIDSRILVWTSKGDLLQKEKVGGPLYCIAWDTRRMHLVTGGNCYIRVYSIIQENVDLPAKDKAVIKWVCNIKAHTDLVRGIVCTDSGKIFSAGYDKSLCIYDSDHVKHQPKKNCEFKNCHQGAISAITFDGDNNWVITGAFDRCVKLWSGDGKALQSFDGFNDTLTGLCYVPATKTLWMSANSAHPIVYDPRSGMNITDFIQASTGPEDKEQKERIQRLFGIPETCELVGTSNTRQLVIWRYNPYGACSILRGHTDWVEVLAYCYKRKKGEGEESSIQIFSGGADTTIRKWEPYSRLNPFLYSNTEKFSGHKGAVLCAVYNEELDTVITGSDDKSIRVWNCESGPQKDYSEQTKMVLEGHTERVTGLACVGHMLVSVSWDLTIRFWDVLGGGHLAHTTENAHDDYILGVEYSPDLDQVATCSADQGVKIWDFQTKTLCATLRGHTADVSQIKWNGVFKVWVTGSEDQTIRMWSHDGVVTHVIRSQGDAITALCIDVKSGFVLAASMDRSIRVYDPFNSEVVQHHAGHTDAVRCILHVPEKNQYISASWDHTIRVWRAHIKSHSGDHVDHEVAAEGHLVEDKEVVGEEEDEDGAAARSETKEEKHQPTYAELHPLTQPKTLNMTTLNKSSYEKFLRTVQKEDSKEKKKKKQSEEELQAKSVQTGLSLRLNELEGVLRTNYDRADKPTSKEDKRLRTKRMGGANQKKLGVK